MGGDDATAAAEGGADSDGSAVNGQQQQHGSGVVNIDPRGDIILHVTFHTSPETLRRSRKANAARKTPKVSAAAPAEDGSAQLQPKVEVRYRASVAVLRANSRYFDQLLSNAGFREAKAVSQAHEALARRGVKPADAVVDDLPCIAVSDDDEATGSAGRELVFEDMLRIMHGTVPARDVARPAAGKSVKDATGKPVNGAAGKPATAGKPAAASKTAKGGTPVKSANGKSANGAAKPNGTPASTAAPAPRPMSYVTTLAITADRFDCTSTISHHLNTAMRFKWPVTTGRLLRDEATGRHTEVESILRQKVLVAWLLGQPLRLASATRELVLRGSRRWSPFYEDDGETAAWWVLPDGLEHELEYRRTCVLNALASIPRHFLARYASRDRQCKLGYDSSGACDAFQLGQLVRFLCAKNLAFVVDFGPDSLDALPDTSGLDVETVVAALRTCPAYQVDKHHSNCGPRLRIDPVLDYLGAALSGGALAIPLADWRRRRADVSWAAAAEAEEGGTFAFTRALANDQRLRYDGAMYADAMARRLFTARAWDWTPEV